MKKLSAWLRKSNWVQHLAFWVLSFYLIGSYFSISGIIKLIDFIYSGFFHIPLVLLVYLNIRYLVPRFLQQERLPSYLLLSVLNIGLAYVIHDLLFEYAIPTASSDFWGVFYMVSFTDIEVLLSIFSIYVIISTLLKLSKSWYHLQEIEKEKLSLELNSLKLQINPHFLFNSLNSIYSLSLKKSDQAPGIILELSNLLRYMIYEVSDDRVPLSKEVAFIKSYIDLQKLRVSSKAKISFDLEGEIKEQNVPPLLFFPLIENSFKHGLQHETNQYVNIELKVHDAQLDFKIKNDKSTVDYQQDKKYGGIGLENVQRRLDLIYAEKATFHILEDENSFEVSLTVPLYD
ncbi:MAG: histidine kinase [Cyclobacteriaceae bacterium]